jgi:hemerythrin-like domain-containing protein
MEIISMQQLGSENIVEILKNEHNLVRSNLKKVLDGNSVDQEVISQTASAALNHFNGEEKLVFPKFESMPETRRLTFALYEEHGVARKLISDLESGSMDADRWLAKVKVLDDLVNAHFKDEEEVVFPKAQEMLSAQALEDIGRRYNNQQF